MSIFNNYNFLLNNLFHILILLSFLTILFFTFISKTEERTVNNELNKVIDESVPSILKKFDNIDKNDIIGIKWNTISDLADKLDDKYKGSDPNIKKHNNNLLKTSIIICISLFVIIIAIIIYTKIIKNYDIGLLEIIKENIIIFSIVGLIELLFFINIALKYSPVNASDMSSDIIDRIQENIKDKLL